MNKILIAMITMTLVGCGHFTRMEHVYIDNSSVNNYVGNPCAFYVGDRCIYMKPTARNPERNNNVK
jgi:hypothetical protein